MLSIRATVLWNTALLDPFAAEIASEFLQGSRREVGILTAWRHRFAISRLLEEVQQLLLTLFWEAPRHPLGLFDDVTARTNGLDKLPGRFSVAGNALDTVVWNLHALFECVSSKDESCIALEKALQNAQDCGNLIERFFADRASSVRKKLYHVELLLESSFQPSECRKLEIIPEAAVAEIVSQFKFFNANRFLRNSLS